LKDGCADVRWCWLVVWNMTFMTSHSVGNVIILTFLFFRGVETTNQLKHNPSWLIPWLLFYIGKITVELKLPFGFPGFPPKPFSIWSFYFGGLSLGMLNIRRMGLSYLLYPWRY
jgi:hypothetical protein